MTASQNPLQRALHLPLAALLALPLLSGCYGVRKHQVDHVVVAPQVQDATVDQLLAAMARQYTAIQSLTLSLQVSGSEGDEHTGVVKEFPTVSGYLFLRKPADLRLQLRSPVVPITIFDLVSDGKNFKGYIPPKSLEYMGTESQNVAPKPGFQNLRPAVIRDALLIPPLAAGEYVNPTKGSRILPQDTRREANKTASAEGLGKQDIVRKNGRQEYLEEPDYDLNFVRVKQGQVLETVRVVHISRVTLLPYEQDIYQDGNVVEKVEYENYQKFGEINFPLSITITRPLEQYKVKLDFSKLTLNPELSDDTFQLKIPGEGITVKQMQ